MIDVLVVSILLLLAIVVLVWVLRPRVREHIERPKHELLARLVRYEAVHPRRAVVDPHASVDAKR